MGSTTNKRKRPHINFPMDLGSDGNTGFHGLQNHFRLNTDQYADQNHNCNNDWNGLLGEVGARGMMILNCTCWNLKHGPSKGEEVRAHEFKDTLKNLRSASISGATFRQVPGRD